MENLYLAHHGIKGQKWGVRRYQNPDGSLTAKGKSRHAEWYGRTGSNKSTNEDYTKVDSVSGKTRNKWTQHVANQTKGKTNKQLVTDIVVSNGAATVSGVLGGILVQSDYSSLRNMSGIIEAGATAAATYRTALDVTAIIQRERGRM